MLEFITRITGYVSVVSGVVGMIYINNYDSMLGRTTVLGQNASIGIAVCIIAIVVGLCHIAYWKNV